jgi:arylsulfatase A-like enzyme
MLVRWMLLLSACLTDAPPDHVIPELPPDIVLIVVSGLRADVGEDGAEAAIYRGMNLSPNLRFANAYAQSCTPFASLGSMLTGRYPSAVPLCGTYDPNSLVAKEGEDVAWCATIPEQTWTLPEVLGVYGYRTGAYVSNAEGDAATNWDTLNKHSARWWAEDDSMPRLYFVQVLDLHMLQFDSITGYSEQSPGLDRRQASVTREQLLPLYIQRAQSVGKGIRELLEQLPPSVKREREVWLTSTNGLSLRETTGLKSDHLSAVTNAIIVDRTVHVPLARFGGRGRHEDERVVELIDVLPTLSTLAGAQVPAGAQGHNLLSAAPDPSPWAYAEFGDMLALRSGDDLLTFRYFLHNASSLDPRLTTGLLDWEQSDEQMMSLHTITTDHLQAQDRVAEVPDRLQELYMTLRDVRTGPGAAPPDEMTAERLRALQMSPAQGYW